MDLEHLCTGNDMNRLMLRANLSVFKGLMQSTLLSLLNLKFEDLTSNQGRVGWGKMGIVGQSKSMDIFICMPK